MRMLLRQWSKVVLLGVTAVVLASSDSAAAAQWDSSRPVLLLVHGCCQESSREQAERRWLKDLADGLAVAGAPGLIQAPDVRFFWYAGLFGKPVQKPCNSHESIPHSSYLGGDNALVAVKNGIIATLSHVLSTSTLLQEATMRRFLPDVSEYLTNTAKRCEIQDHVIKLFRDLGAQKRRVVIAAHSLGSIVFFDVLYDYSPYLSDKDFFVDEFITFGSMLGYPSVVEGLLGRYVKPPYVMPSRVRAWTNVANTHDPFAAPFKISGRLVPVAGHNELRESEISVSEGNNHSSSVYFKSADFVRTVVSAWCRSAQLGGNPIPGCLR